MTPAGMVPLVGSPASNLMTWLMGDGEVVSIPAGMVKPVELDGALYAFRADVRDAQMAAAIAELRDGDIA